MKGGQASFRCLILINMKRNILKHFLFINLISISVSALAQAPNGYYNSIDGKQKIALKTELHNIIKGHTPLSYSALWTAFTDTDKKPNGKVWDMYSDVPESSPPYEYTFITDQCGNYNAEGVCYNREHSFPKSWFNDASPMYTDLFHLYPTDGYVNGRRGNHPFGEVGISSWTSQNGSKLGKNTTNGYTGTVFEPIDAYKGDFARSYFYMATRYEDKIANWTSDMLSKDKYPAYKQWAVDLLLKWHREDPVSTKEINRNNVIYTSYQYNRNPFIDYPELVEYIWGNKTNDVYHLNELGTQIEEQAKSREIYVYSLDGNIIVETDRQIRHIQIYDLFGRTVVFSKGDNVLNLFPVAESQFYIVKADTDIFKVYVK